MITKHDILTAIGSGSWYHHRYETATGQPVTGCAVSKVSEALRDCGWRRVPRLDSYDLTRMGLTIVKAQYVGGARPTGRFVDLVVADPNTTCKWWSE